MSTFVGPKKVGILGSGQLARMLAQAAQNLGLIPVVLGDAADDPACQVVSNVVLGGIKSEAAVEELFRRADTVIFESEFVDEKILEAALKKVPARLLPQLPTICQVRDKTQQKLLFQTLHLPTSPFSVFDPKTQSLEAWLHTVCKDLGPRAILKWGQFGYDGKGVFFVDDKLGNLDKALAFCNQALSRNATLFAEKRVAFQRELAMVACRSSNGEFLSYPLVFSEQERGVCVRVYGPAIHFGVSQDNQRLAAKILKKIADTIDLVGCFAVEFFELENGDLCLNEMAPRVHNSGHYTLNGCATSQFENHWRAVLGLPLGTIECQAIFAMRNVLGPEGIVRAHPSAPVPNPSVQMHWYGKAETRPGRKMGHLNAVSSSPENLSMLLGELDRCHLEWVEHLNKKERHG